MQPGRSGSFTGVLAPIGFTIPLPGLWLVAKFCHSKEKQKVKSIIYFVPLASPCFGLLIEIHYKINKI
jgi:hypothetical protein